VKHRTNGSSQYTCLAFGTVRLVQVQMRWAWSSVPAVLVVGMIGFLAAVVVGTRQRGEEG